MSKPSCLFILSVAAPCRGKLQSGEAVDAFVTSSATCVCNKTDKLQQATPRTRSAPAPRLAGCVGSQASAGHQGRLGGLLGIWDLETRPTNGKPSNHHVCGSLAWSSAGCQADAATIGIFFFFAGVLGRLGIRIKTGDPDPEMPQRRRFISQLAGRGRHPKTPSHPFPWCPALLPLAALRLVLFVWTLSAAELASLRPWLRLPSCLATWLPRLRTMSSRDQRSRRQKQERGRVLARKRAEKSEAWRGRREPAHTVGASRTACTVRIF